MAQPENPEVNETFLREVDENLRRDQLRDFGKKYGRWIITAAVLFLVVSGGWIWWQSYQHKQSEEQVEAIAQAYKDIALNQDAKASKALDPLTQSRSKAVRASALFTNAALAIEKGDTAKAATIYREIAADSALPQSYRDAALIRATALNFDKLKPEEVVSRLAPLAKPENPWYGSAGEMTALALIKQNKRQEAGRLFAALAADKTIPPNIRDRSLQIAGSLGADATAALDQPAE